MSKAGSSQSSVPDPLQAWREWVDQAERQWNSVLNEFMGSEQFGEASGRMMEAFLGFQSSMNEATQRYLSALNLPTRTDLLSLGDRLATIETCLVELDRKLDALSPQAATPRSRAPRPKPKRTKKAPAKTEGATATKK